MSLAKVAIEIVAQMNGNVIQTFGAVTGAAEKLNKEAGKTGENFRNNMGKGWSRCAVPVRISGSNWTAATIQICR